MDKFIFLADFVVLDFEEYREIPLILGRPFLATRRTLIEVQNGELTTRVYDQEIKFNVFKAIKFPNNVEECYLVKEGKEVVHDESWNSRGSINSTSVNLDIEKETIEGKGQFVKHYWGCIADMNIQDTPAKLE